MTLVSRLLSSRAYSRTLTRSHVRVRSPVTVAVLALACIALTTLAAPAFAGKKPASDDAPDLVTYGRRPDLMAFAADLAARRGLDPQWVQDTLAQARYVPTVTRFIMPAPAGTAKNWAAYRARFVEPIRIRAGAAFWRANAQWLQLAEQRYGVPPEIVVGIVGVETIYGQQMGNFKTIDALATLAFDFPTGRKDRSAFFRDELENLLAMCQNSGADPLQVRGSFAGAMGMPQFMPSSVLKYAVDMDGDGHIDLRNSAADVIGSVAHYLAEFGWRRDLPTRFDVAVPVATADRAVLLEPDILPTFALTDFNDHGARVGAAAWAADVRLQASGGVGKLALVELQNGDAAPSYVAGTSNFYAVTRYNWSSYYALAVIELGEAVKRVVERDAPRAAATLAPAPAAASASAVDPVAVPVPAPVTVPAPAASAPSPAASEPASAPPPAEPASAP